MLILFAYILVTFDFFLLLLYVSSLKSLKTICSTFQTMTVSGFHTTKVNFSVSHVDYLV